MNVRLYLSYDIKSTLKSHVGVKVLRFCHMCAIFLWASLPNVTKICKPLVVY